MSVARFPEGNIILLYANYRGTLTNEKLPEHIVNRVRVCKSLYGRILKSKPDGLDTEIYLISTNLGLADSIKRELRAKPLNEKMITIIPEASLTIAMGKILKSLRKRTNIPTLYLITSHWQREIYDNALLKFKEFKIHFEGALDHRPIGEIDMEKDVEIPSKGLEFYKSKAKNKAIDMLLNHMFPDKENEK